jgi:hypothetical protein
LTVRRDPLAGAWVGLLLLSGLSAVLALSPVNSGALRPAAGAVLLVLAGLKGRLILLHYLGLAATAFWRRGFLTALVVLLALLLAVYGLAELR